MSVRKNCEDFTFPGKFAVTVSTGKSVIATEKKQFKLIYPSALKLWVAISHRVMQLNVGIVQILAADKSF